MKDMVLVYSADTCPYCVELKKWLNNLGVEFKELSPNELPGISVIPVTFIGEDGPFIGFDKENILKALDSHNLLPEA